MFYEMRMGLFRYWRWVSNGGFWTKLAGIGGPILAVLIVIGAVSGSNEQQRRQTTPSSNVLASQATRPPPSATSTPVPTATQEATPTVDPALNRHDCDAIRGSQYLSPEEREWYLSNCTAAAATPTASTGVRQSFDEYTAELYVLAVVYAGELDNLASLASNPLFTQSWYQDVGRSAGRILGYSEQFRELRPPTCLQAAHDALIAGLDDIDQAARLFTSGLGSFDVSQIELAGDYMNNGAAKIGIGQTLVSSARC
jgi:hypothetical protein